MDNEFYYEAVGRMQKMNVDSEYIQGWIGGYMKNPQREEQRRNDAYEAGYTDGENRETGNFESWISA